MKVKDPDQSPKATSTSGLTVFLVSNKPSVCTIDFLKIHAVAAGTCSITATQNGNSIYSPATSVEKTFTIIGVDPVTPGEPDPPVVFPISSISSDEETAAGYFVEKDGRIAILSGHFHITYFRCVYNLRKWSSDGSNGWQVHHFCRKASNGIYSNAISSAITIYVQHKSDGQEAR